MGCCEVLTGGKNHQASVRLAEASRSREDCRYCSWYETIDAIFLFVPMWNDSDLTYLTQLSRMLLSINLTGQDDER